MKLTVKGRGEIGARPLDRKRKDEKERAGRDCDRDRNRCNITPFNYSTLDVGVLRAQRVSGPRAVGPLKDTKGIAGRGRGWSWIIVLVKSGPSVPAQQIPEYGFDPRVGSDRDPDMRPAAELCREQGSPVRSCYQPLGELAVCSPHPNRAEDGLVVHTESGSEGVRSLRAVVADPDMSAGEQRSLSQRVVGSAAELRQRSRGIALGRWGRVIHLRVQIRGFQGHHRGFVIRVEEGLGLKDEPVIVDAILNEIEVDRQEFVDEVVGGKDLLECLRVVVVVEVCEGGPERRVLGSVFQDAPDLLELCRGRRRSFMGRRVDEGRVEGIVEIEKEVESGEKAREGSDNKGEDEKVNGKDGYENKGEGEARGVVLVRVVASVEGVLEQLDGKLTQEVGDGGEGYGEKDDVEAEEGEDCEHGRGGLLRRRVPAIEVDLLTLLEWDEVLGDSLGHDLPGYVNEAVGPVSRLVLDEDAEVEFEFLAMVYHDHDGIIAIRLGQIGDEVDGDLLEGVVDVGGRDRVQRGCRRMVVRFVRLADSAACDEAGDHGVHAWPPVVAP
ncbi:hypothetical protein C8Q76DRAFT_695024 [Earliella scabrosa]|nr:hypothetical protein C8Q76DRAFT_695024 [Earliella scabrosa]